MGMFEITYTGWNEREMLGLRQTFGVFGNL